MKDHLEEKYRRIMQMRPINDTFFEALAEDIPFCQEILRVILEDPKLIVKSVVPQKDVHKLFNRSVRLDVLCELGDGTTANVEVQRSDNDNHLKRIRYNEACITTNITDPGTEFENVPTVIVVYISEFDFLKGGKTTYHIDKVVRETGEIIEDGTKTVCVNTKIDDGTDIAELMQCFLQTEVENPKFPAFSKKVYELKHTKRGLNHMCAIMEDYAKSYAKEYAEDIIKKKIEKALNEGLEVEQIARIFETSEEKILSILSSMEG